MSGADDGPRSGVAGWPVAHSRSPLIHTYWLKELDLAGSYQRFAVPPGEFSRFATEIGRHGLVGANVTVPHKEAAFSACDRRTPVAEALGAVNTLWRDGALLWGDNTDVEGFLANMDERRARLGAAKLSGCRHWGRGRRSGGRSGVGVARPRPRRHRQPDADPSRRARRAIRPDRCRVRVGRPQR